MRNIFLIIIWLIITSCENRNVRFSGLNDLVIGVQQIVLYENNEFYMELGLGGSKGKYVIENDTVFLDYYEKPKNWPDKLLITKDYFITIEKDSTRKPIKIRRK